MIVRTLLLLLCLTPGFAFGETALSFHLPLPDGWHRETIPFPLEFAPGLEYEGLEELRFAPGMFDAEADDFWSYAFVWWIPDHTPIDADRLARDLRAYFAGLTASVARSRKIDPQGAKHEITLEAAAPAADSRLEYTGTANVFDSFVTLEQVRLQFRVTRTPCPEVGYQAVIFELSPQPRSHPIWTDLAAIRDEFCCE